MQGKIVKGIAGFYYVHVVESGVYECKAKGIFRKDKKKPLVGDDVEIEVLSEVEKTGSIINIFERKNELIRPAVANIDQALVVFAAAKPSPHFNLLDRFLVMMDYQNVPVIVCFNKVELVDEKEQERLRSIYEKCGCRVLFMSIYENKGVDELKKLEVPIVFLDAEPKDNEFDIVTGEDFESAYRVTQLAIMSGMKNVGFYSSWNQDFSTCSARKNGIKKALEDSRIPIREGQLLLRNTESEFHESVTKYDIVTDIKEYLQKNDYLDVLIVMNDTVAFAAYKAASELRKDIPDDLKLISYGNYNWSSFPTIGLTTFEQHFFKYGKEAVKLLLKRMSGTSSMIQQRRIIKYDLQRRKSF